MRCAWTGPFLLTGLILGGCAGAPPETPPEPSAELRPTSPAPAEPASAPAGPRTTDLQVSIRPAEDPGLRVARGYTAQLYAGELEALFEKFSPEMKTNLPLDQLKALHAHMVDNYGRETEVIGEKSRRDGEYRGFMRWTRFDKHDGVIEVLWILREDDTIAGLFVRPAKQPPAD